MRINAYTGFKCNLKKIGFYFIYLSEYSRASIPFCIYTKSDKPQNSNHLKLLVRPTEFIIKIKGTLMAVLSYSPLLRYSREDVK